jgi:hypothetical protein
MGQMQWKEMGRWGRQKTVLKQVGQEVECLLLSERLSGTPYLFHVVQSTAVTERIDHALVACKYVPSLSLGVRT